jgi:hypothetical protein
VGIFPADICTFANSVKPGVNASGCNGAVLDTLASTTPIQIILKFAVAVVADTSVGFAYSAASEKTEDLTLSIHDAGSTLSCPSMASAYFPGDGSILVGEGFSASTPVGAPSADALIVIGNDATSNVTTGTTFGSANSVIGRIAIGSNSYVTGFTNTTTGSDHLYDVSFAVRDVSGRVSAFETPSGAGTCSIENVQTSDIQGFLKASKCFIATAAFESMDVPPVALLRQFREKRLRGFALGRNVIALYERYSPPAADWLIENPAFRPAVRVALLPFIAVAWIALHPGSLLLVLALAGSVTLALTWFSVRGISHDSL